MAMCITCSSDQKRPNLETTNPYESNSDSGTNPVGVEVTPESDGNSEHQLLRMFRRRMKYI